MHKFQNKSGVLMKANVPAPADKAIQSKTVELQPKPLLDASFEDARSEAVAQKKLQFVMESSPQVKQLKVAQAAMDSSARVSAQKQAAMMTAKPVQRQEQGGVVQRAVTIGTNALPRTNGTPPNIVSFLQTNGIYNEFVSLNDDRNTIYLFENDQHFVNYLKMMAGQVPSNSVPAPLRQPVSPQQLQQGHEFAQDVRFTNIYQPSSSQISEKAPGAHKIPNAMMPPSGQGHHWAQTQDPSTFGQEYVLHQNQFQAPPTVTPLTFGNPNSPSLVMNQGGLNLGMHIQPTHDSTYLDPITRSDTNYAGIPSATDRVRGHPFELKQNQISTDNPNKTFDNDSRTYTDESDSTKANGGISSWRFNEVEKVATNNGRPFTQINNNPVKGPMGIARPDTIDFRIDQGGTYKDLHMDNTGTTDYRNTDGVRPSGMGKQAYQTEMGRQEALTHPYQAPPIHKQGQDFTDPQRHTYPGYMSPPPTPFLSEDTLSDAPQVMILAGYPHVGSRVNMPDGSTGMVVKVLDRDSNRVKSRCEVKVIPTTEWPNNFGVN